MCKSLCKPSKVVCYDIYELGGFSYESERKESVKQLIKEFDLKDTNDISNMFKELMGDTIQEMVSLVKI